MAIALDMTTRLMCSRDRKEVEAVKSELFRNGIRSEIRNNPVAEALRVSRVELWLKDECDFFLASKLYLAFQERGTGKSAKAPEEELQPSEDTEVYVDAEEAAVPQDAKGQDTPPASRNAPVTQAPADTTSPEGAFAEVSGLLEKEIENLLARDSNLDARCASLEKTIGALEKALGEAEARAQQETSARTAAEKNASEMAELHASLKNEVAERAAAEQKLQQTVTALRAELKSQEQTATTALTKTQAQAHELKEQQTLVIALRNELAAREHNLKELGDALTQAGVEVSTEKQARIAAEERLSECAVARAALEQQVARQTQELQQTRAELQAREAQMQVFVGRLNSLCGRMQGRS